MAGMRAHALQLTANDTDATDTDATDGGSTDAGSTDASRPARALLGATDVRALAASIGLRPTKTLGQNFVIDGGTVQRIVRIAAVGADDVVLEVGPGLGSLTLALLPAVRSVVAVEVDARLAGLLAQTITARAPAVAQNLTVVHHDALRLDSFPGPAPTAIVANLPYNIAVPVLLHLLPLLPSVRRVLVMVQLEVAERLAAKAGEPAYGVPSVKARWYGDLRLVGTIGRQVFWPAPRVDSGLVALDRRDPPQTSATRAQVFAVVDAAFGQRRKTLRAALAGWAGSPSAAEAVLRSAGVDPSARGETLDVTAFARIAEHAGPVRSAGRR
jgi:16S rRNA (adenine1518-N6/adenine1519-N6)-dimethyltransferase